MGQYTNETAISVSAQLQIQTKQWIENGISYVTQVKKKTKQNFIAAKWFQILKFSRYRQIGTKNQRLQSANS
jgi:hypothetical protein